MKKALKIISLCILGLIVALGLCVWNMFGSLVKGAMSVEKLDDGLYYMEFSGDDGFDELMANGGVKDSDELMEYIAKFMSKGYYTLPASVDSTDFGCSTLTVSTPDNNVLMGRNFDFPSATAMILHTTPKRGYENISTFNMEFYGFGDEWLPEGFQNQFLALSGLFLALDGINEKGFAIADLMAGDNVETHQNTGKPSLTTTSAIAYLLKNAASVDEAIDLLGKIDMHSDIGAAHHYAMSDASGKSVVVEYVDNQMVVTETHAVTNHYLCQQKHNAGLIAGDHRYEQLCHFYDSANGVMDKQQLNDAVFSVAQQPWGENFVGGTQWTIIMNLTEHSATYYWRRNFDKPFSFRLKR
ncbi:MAG: linear amide C-N hydrolase [Salinivirgaceae bacterium]|nr:linear amide C-N hydrolase [Salinivirgaceae bacterium]